MLSASERLLVLRELISKIGLLLLVGLHIRTSQENRPVLEVSPFSQGKWCRHDLLDVDNCKHVGTKT